MAIKRGQGIAAVNYPTGMNLGGDPTQALIHCTPTGSFIISLSSVDLGQGIKTVGAQIAAESLGVPVDLVRVDLGDTDTGPHCMGTFASRLTHRAGNAIIMAAREARNVMLEVAAEELEVAPEDLETDGVGNVRVMGAPVDRNPVSVNANVGVVLKAPFDGRDNDVAGLALTYIKVGSHARGFDQDSGNAVRGSETALEATYQYQVTPWWQVQGDLQYTFNAGAGQNPNNPAQSLRNTFVVGVRTNITF